jgi:hypothetical protein
MSWPRFTPGKRTPGTHCIGGWVGPRAGLETDTRGKILWFCLRSNPGRLCSSTYICSVFAVVIYRDSYLLYHKLSYYTWTWWWLPSTVETCSSATSDRLQNSGNWHLQKVTVTRTSGDKTHGRGREMLHYRIMKINVWLYERNYTNRKTLHY